MMEFERRLNEALGLQSAQELYSRAYKKLSDLDGQIVVPDEVWEYISPLHATVVAEVEKALNNNPKIKYALNIMNAMLINSFVPVAKTKPAYIEVVGEGKLTGILGAYVNWRDICTDERRAMVPQIDATSRRRLNVWKSAINDIIQMIQMLG